MANEPITYAQFYEAVGAAVATWGRVEDKFCDLFTRLTVCALTGAGMGMGKEKQFPDGEGIFMLGNIFYAGTNFRGRIELINLMFRRLIRDETLVAEWNAIKNKAGRLYARRNVLAHGQVWGRGTVDPAFMRYSIFEGIKREEMDFKRICAATPSFERYADRIEQLAIAANAFLARRKRHPEDTAN